MTAAEAGQLLAIGAWQVADAAAEVTGYFFFGLFALAALSWTWMLWDVKHQDRRRSRREHAATQPTRVIEPVIDDGLPLFFEHRRYEDDTFLLDGATTELNELLRGDGRG